MTSSLAQQLQAKQHQVADPHSHHITCYPGNDGTHTSPAANQATCCCQGITHSNQTFIATGDRKLNDIQVRFDELPNIFDKFECAQSELELSDEADYSVDRQQFEDQYFDVKAKFNELLHPMVDPPRSRHSYPCSSLSGHSNTSPRSHASTSYFIANL